MCLRSSFAAPRRRAAWLLACLPRRGLSRGRPPARSLGLRDFAARACSAPGRDPAKWANPLCKAYVQLGNLTHVYVYQQEEFGYFIMFCVIVATVIVGMQTYDGVGPDNKGDGAPHPLATEPGLVALDSVILCIFILEIVLKVVAESMAPWRCVRSRKSPRA